MSTKYNLEPPPTAKVLLHTSAGDLELELFGKQTPLTTRNFLQHCLDGYYDNTIFHRLVPGFVIQGGDPTGSGSGGESIYASPDGSEVAGPGEAGVPFKDEFHSRLRFNRRGLVGMASEGQDGNGSQFFLTLGATPELQGVNTLFGRVVGDSIFTLVKMGEAELGDSGERPLFPEKVTSAEILVNPFEDMVKRDIKKQAVVTNKRVEKVQTKRKAGKAALSFADEEDVAPVAKRAKLGPKTAPREPMSKPKVPSQHENTRPVKPEDPDSEREFDEEDITDTQRTNAKSDIERQIAELKASMKRDGAAPAPKEEKKTTFESLIPDTATRGRKKPKTTKDRPALSLYYQLKNQIDTNPAGNGAYDDEHEPDIDGDAPAKAAGAGDDEDVCDLHFIPNCMSCAKWKDEDEKDDAEEAEEENWFNRKLNFAKDRLGKDLEWKRKNEELSFVDPREKERQLGIKQPKGAGTERRRDERR